MAPPAVAPADVTPVAGHGRRVWGPVLLVAVAATVASLLLLPAHAVRSARTTADEPQYLLTAISLVEDGDLDIADELAAGRWRDFHAATLPRQTEPRADGTEISPHDPGLPALLAVPVAVGGWAGAKAALAACNGLLAGLLVWTAVRRFGVRTAVAGPAVLAFAVAPPLAVYGAQVYPELPAACCVAGIIALAGASRHRVAAMAGVGALAVAAAWLSVKYVPVAGALVLLVLADAWSRGERRVVAGVTAGGVVLGALYAWVHVRWYGGLTAYASGDFFADRGGQLAVMGDRPDRLARTQRLGGLLVDRDFGLAAWQPAWLAVAPALGALVARRPPRWTLLAVPLAVGWAMGTWVAVTMHGWWWPRPARRARAAVRRCWRSRGGSAACGPASVVAWVAAALGAASTLWLAADAAWRDVTLVFDPWATTSAVHRVMRPLLPDLRADTAVDDVALVAWTVALVAAGVVAVPPRTALGPATPSVLDDVVPEAVA